jgi:phenylalanyl-tRNA synthetase beta chain
LWSLVSLRRKRGSIHEVSFNWLRDYVDIPVDVDDLVKHFTMKGLTVEDAHPVPLEVSNVVSARVLSTSAHPQRQDLKVGEVTDGTRVYSVVSGAPGFEEDKVVVLALPGSTLPGGIVVGTREVDGVISEGMVVCSNEILTGNAHREGEDIIILPDTTVLGKPVQDVLGLDDYLLDLELTVNYSHCLSVLGVAIECAAMFNIPLKLPPTLTQWDWAGPKGSVPPSGYLEAQGDEEFTIELPDPDLCPRYVGKSVLGIKPHYSHVQIERRLMVAGMRPINAIVDATNYVMLETGQPLHAFDRDLISGKVVYARRSRRGEKLRTLDGEQREIQEGTLVIADSSGPIAIAGVMGGANTEVTSKTKNILLETAYFSPRSVRETSQRLRLRTEAAIRFEKGLDPTMQVAVAEHAAHLITQLAGAWLLKESPKRIL